MYFLQPIGLLAAAGIVLPLIVHFWNDRRGKVLKIGSIALFDGASQRMAWSRTVTQWWLLMLRCLLVLAAALLLARPFWKGTDRRVKGWVLVDEGVSGAGLASESAAGMLARVDSLVQNGWERHLLSDTLDSWEGFREADRMAPVRLPFFVFSSGLMSRFGGERPVSDRSVHWEVYTPKDTLQEWVADRWAIGSDSVRVVHGEARLTSSLFRYSVEAGVGDTSTLEVSIDKKDSRFLMAGVQAVQEFTRRRVRVVEKPGGKHIGADTFGTELISSRAFPTVLARTLFGEAGPGKHDVRVIDGAQVAPLFVEGKGNGLEAAGIDLAPAVWGLVFLLFILERWFNSKV